jgi:hypothetical protein
MTNNNRESIRKQLYQMVGSALDEETRKVALSLAVEHQKAVDELVQENKSAIEDMVEEGKKIIRAKAQEVPTSDTPQTDYIEDLIEHIYRMVEIPDNDTGLEIPESEVITNNIDSIKWTELEILPSLRLGRNTSN